MSPSFRGSLIGQAYLFRLLPWRSTHPVAKYLIAKRMCYMPGKFSSIFYRFSRLDNDNRFLYLRFLLYRPTFTQVCSEETQSRHLQSQGERQPAKSTLHASIKPKCAAACVKTATDLVSTVFDTYRSSRTDTWWYNGFCKMLQKAFYIPKHNEYV